MAISRRAVAQGANGNAASVAATAFASNPIAGETIVVLMATANITATTHQAPTDSTSANTYTQIGTTAGDVGSFHLQLSMWRASNITGGSSFVVTGHTAATTAITIVAWCLSGAATASYNGDVVSATATSTNPSAGTTTPAPAANSFFIAGAMNDGANSSITAGSGWQFETNSAQTDNTSFQSLYTEDLTGATASTAQTGLFSGVSSLWVAIAASFAPSVVAGADTQEWRGCSTDIRNRRSVNVMY